MARHPSGPGPAIAGDLTRHFRQTAERMASTVDEVSSMAEAPGAVARYLVAQGLAPKVVVWPQLAELDWAAAGVDAEARRPKRDESQGADPVGVTGCFCALAETGTLVLTSSRETPSSTHLLPETHIAIVPASRIVATMEDAFALMRAERGGVADMMPRAINMVSGPSRTGDIEQTIVLGAHGPYRVHIVVVARRLIETPARGATRSVHGTWSARAAVESAVGSRTPPLVGWRRDAVPRLERLPVAGMHAGGVRCCLPRRSPASPCSITTRCRSRSPARRSIALYKIRLAVRRRRRPHGHPEPCRPRVGRARRTLVHCCCWASRLLARSFRGKPRVPADRCPRYLPDDWKGGFVLLMLRVRALELPRQHRRRDDRRSHRATVFTRPCAHRLPRGHRRRRRNAGRRRQRGRRHHDHMVWILRDLAAAMVVEAYIAGGVGASHLRRSSPRASSTRSNRSRQDATPGCARRLWSASAVGACSSWRWRIAINVLGHTRRSARASA